MAKDKANIFNLENEFKDYEKDPFCDCFESVKAFANALKKDIETKETPHVLLLEAEYGMGKTFFATRFTHYLDAKCDINTIYFSVWENDYYIDPFIAFSKAIISYITKQSLCSKIKYDTKKLFNCFKNVIKSTKINFGADLSVNGKGVKGGIILQVDDLIKSFQSKKDPICEFKKELENFITKLNKNETLVIIVDELDRCRPDYAMKTLECIKHFFDIEGLFVILPTNKIALNDALLCLHRIDNNQRIEKAKESYFRKFFNDVREIKKPTEADYKYIVEQYINKECLDDALKKKLITTTEKYNSINTLVNSMANYTHKADITPRELKDMCFEIVRMCNNFYEPVRCEWLSCLMANKNKTKNYDFTYPLPKKHCFHKERYGFNGNSYENGKGELFSLQPLINTFKNLQGINFREYYEGKSYNDFINEYKKLPETINSYESIDNYFITLTKTINEIKSEYNSNLEVIANLKNIENAIATQKESIKEYQDKYGSDDKDDVRIKRYDEIIQNPETIYSNVNN